MMKNALAQVRDYLRRYQTHLVTAGLVFVALLVFLWPRIFVSIHPGELGVLYSRFFGGTVLDRTYQEGMHVIVPWNRLFVYDVRIQEETQVVEVLTLDGLTVSVHASLRYQIIRDRLPILHQQIGPDYKRKIILPIMTSAVRQTIGSYRPDALYSTAREEMQDNMLVDATEELGRIPIVIHGFVVKEIILPEPLRNSIVDKLVAEQKYLRYHYLLLEAKEEAKRKAIEGEAVRYYQSLVNENMTENFLRYEGIRATANLAASPNAKVVVVGSGKDGLPIILNTQDTPRLPDPVNASAAGQPQEGDPDAFNASGNATGPSPAQPNRTTRPPGGGIDWNLRESGFLEFMDRLDRTLLNPGKAVPQGSRTGSEK